MYFPYDTIDDIPSSPFNSYEEIPELTKECLMTIAGAKTIMEIPLDDINRFIEFMMVQSHEHEFMN